MCLKTQKTLNAKKSLKIPKGQSEYMYIVDVKQGHTNELEIKDATYRDNSASYLDLHLTIDSEGCNKNFDSPIVNFCDNVATFKQHLHIGYISLS